MRRIRCWAVRCSLLLCILLIANAAVGAEKDEVIKVGASVSLTGGLSRFGTLVKNGYELWKETVNAAGGIKIAGKKMKVDIIYYDDQSDNQTSAKLTEKLITEDKVQFLLSPFGSGPTFATTAIGEKYNIITMASMANAGKIYDRGFKNVFSIAPPGKVFLWSFLDLMKTMKPAPKKVAIITPNDLFPVSVAKGARERCEQLGFDVVYYEEYPKGVKDLSSTILKIKHSGADVLMSSGYLEEAILTRRQLSEQRVKLKAMCFTTGPEHHDFRKILGEDANNVFGVSWWMPEMKYTGPLFGSSSDYANLFTKRFGPGVTQQAAGASQAGLLLQLALEKAGALETNAVRKALRAYEGTTFWGPTKWDKTGKNVGGSSVAFQIQKGELKTVFPQAAAVAKPLYPLP
jgi:branched-chain amino acid transport system substrate-binding protein